MFERIDKETDRLEVPQGWLVRTRLYYGAGGSATHTIFIEDVVHKWKLADKETQKEVE